MKENTNTTRPNHRHRLPLIAALTAALTAIAMTPLSQATEPIRLWPNAAPGALGDQAHDIPTLTRFSPPANSANGTAIVICPGGGYQGLADHEGSGYAQFLAAHGVECFVLKYRLGSHNYRHPAMLNDAQRAIRMVRANAQAFGIHPNRIGIMGSSAGGHLASSALVHHQPANPQAPDPIDRVSSRPDFGILCYAVISMRDGITHQGSRNNLLGKSPDPALVAKLSSDEQVTADTPPCFVWSTGEDPAVPVENSLRFVQALQKHGIAYDFHVYQKGPHGIGLGKGLQPGTLHPWSADLVVWLTANQWLNPPTAQSAPDGK